MMRKWNSLFVALLCAVPVAAQDMKSVFVNMPDSIVPLLTKVNREDCVDFLASDMKAVVKNRFDCSAELKTLTADYLQMQLTEVSTLELKLLPLKDSVQVICMVRTVCASACDSEVRFFGTDWKELPASDYFALPSEEVFYLPKDSVGGEYDELRTKADLYLVKASLSPDDASLTLKYDTPSYINKEDREKLAACLRKASVVLEWREEGFR